MASIIKANQLQDFGGNSIITSDGAGNLTTMKTNYPAFQAFLSANQSVSNDTTTKIQIDSESYDTNNCYDNSTNYRFTPNVAGKYIIYAQITFESVSDTTMQVRIHKNGSVITFSPQKSGTGSSSHADFCSYVDSANGSTDYYELFGYQASGSSKNANGNTAQNRTYFGAYRIGS